jgi:hypothetical protein
MSLRNVSYSEFAGDAKHWQLENCDFAEINLVVGRNATGKTRLINVLSGLCKILAGQQTEVFTSGTYHAEIGLSTGTYVLDLEFSNGEVVTESLDVNGVRRLTRGADGTGEIYYEKQGASIGFQVPRTAIAIQQRRDELQHPFVVTLANWAEGCQTYRFASIFGQTSVIGLTSLQESLAKPDGLIGPGDVVSTYSRAFEKYGAPFDQAVIRDMQTLGYDLSDVGTDDMRQMNAGIKMHEPILGLFVTEVGFNFKLPQFAMSQGMYRALALVIHLNVASFEKRRTLVLVDDIGEGLDFERSVSLIDVLIRHSKEAGLQAIMTTNDRFVMNRVPLENWSLLRREGSVVRAHTARNSPKEFADFKFLGLSNFELFTSATFR